MMRRLIPIILLALCFCLLSACQKKPIEVKDTYGNTISLSEHDGKWLIVNYWAAWCKSCSAELQELSTLHTRYRNKLTVLGVSFDPLTPAEIQKFATPLKLNFPLLSEFPIKDFGIHHISSLPVTFIINPDGKLVQTLYGPQTEHSLIKILGDQL